MSWISGACDSTPGSALIITDAYPEPVWIAGGRRSWGGPMGDITVVCDECGGQGCKKCNYSGTVTIVE